MSTSKSGTDLVGDGDASALRGYIDHVSKEGLVSGWSWDAKRPERRVRVSVLVDGEPVGTTIADLFRGDLKAAGIGDGGYGFTYLLPWPAIAAKRTALVTLAGEAGDPPMHTSVTFRRDAVIPIDERLREVEQQVRMLEARLNDTAQRARHDASVMSGVLATIGAFFTKISEQSLDVIATATVVSLSGLIEATQLNLAPFSLTLSANPDLTICVDSNATLEGVYDCLLAIHEAKLDAEAEIVLIDDGRSDRIALLPTLVQNLRYWRLQSGQSAFDARSSAVLPAGRRFVAFFSAATRVTADWLRQVTMTFDARPDCAVIGAKLVRPDGTIQSSGLLPHRGRLVDFAYAEDANESHVDMLAPVAAVADFAMIMRGEVYAKLDGFDPSYIDHRAAVIDLCLRSWNIGYSVCYQPEASLGWDDPSGIASTVYGPMNPDIAALLANRWSQAERSAWPQPVGTVLLLGAGRDLVADEPDLAAAARIFLNLGYQPTFALTEPSSMTVEIGATLRRMGVHVLRTPVLPEGPDLAMPPFTLLCLTTEAVATLNIEWLHKNVLGSRIALLFGAAADAVASSIVSEVPNDDTLQLLTIVDAVDAVMPLTDAGARGLVRAGKSLKLLNAPASTVGANEKSGLWLLPGTTESATQEARRWFVRSVLPRLRKALPNVVVHETLPEGADPFAQIVAHRSGLVPRELLNGMWLAVAPMRRPAVDISALQSCLEAGLPVIATYAALPSAAVPAGIRLVDADAGILSQHIVAMYKDPAARDNLSAVITVVSPFETIGAASVGARAMPTKQVDTNQFRLLLGKLGLKLFDKTTTR